MSLLADWWRSELQASAAPSTASRNGGTKTQQAKRQSWQAQAFDMEKRLGAVRYAKMYHAGNMAKLRLTAQQQNADGEWEPATDPQAVDVVERLRGPTGSYSRICGRYAGIMFITGEGYLTVMQDDREQETWQFLSNQELTKQPGSDDFKLVTASGGMGRTLTPKAPDDDTPVGPNEVIAYRMWRPADDHSGDAQSPMQTQLDTCQAMLLAGRAIRARLRSRANQAGILLLPTEISPNPVPAGAALDDADAASDPLLADLTEALVTPIQDELDASVLVPLILRGGGDALDKLRLLRLGDAASGFPELDLYRGLVEDFANGIDLPQEIILGSKQINHWTKWAIDDDTWQSHFQPTAEMLVADLTDILMNPVMGDEYRIWYDNAAIISHPNQGQDANEMLDRGAISYASYRERRGVDESEAPTVEDLAILAYIKSNGGNGSDTGEPVSGSEDATPGPPAAVMAASQMARDRCRDIAGSRLRSQIQQDEMRRRLVNGQANQVVWSVLARKAMLPPGADPQRLVSGGADGMIPALVKVGIRRDVAGTIARKVEQEVAEQMASEVARQ